MDIICGLDTPGCLPGSFPKPCVFLQKPGFVCLAIPFPMQSCVQGKKVLPQFQEWDWYFLKSSHVPFDNDPIVAYKLEEEVCCEYSGERLQVLRDCLRKNSLPSSGHLFLDVMFPNTVTILLPAWEGTHTQNGRMEDGKEWLLNVLIGNRINQA